MWTNKWAEPMKIKAIRIQNFRSFLDETIEVNSYTCFVGPNGAGKSTVLSALNFFFQERFTTATDFVRPTEEDFFRRDTARPIRVTLTFCELGEDATQQLSAYVRVNELTVTAEALFDSDAGYASVRHYGNRRGMEEFRRFFDAEKSGARAAELNSIYEELRQVYTELPAARSKDDKAAALRRYEADHDELCTLIPSADEFYGVNSTGKLARYLQWVYVPAVKDAADEGVEAKNTALGRLVARAVRSRSNFDEEIEQLRSEMHIRFLEILDRNQTSLTEISNALQQRLESWAHPNARLEMEWISDPAKSISVQSPLAGIKTGDGEFLGSLSRMGHGLQRSYLLALLHELAGSEDPTAPTLILGVEEPELYQHPPQARHLADVFSTLTANQNNNQILVTTHSPLFVSGDGFENVRVVRRTQNNLGSTAKGLSFQRLCNRIRLALNQDASMPLQGLLAKIHQALQPHVAEMFFTKLPILVEGLEDVAYITSALHLYGDWNEFRRLGCHLIPVGGKDKLIQPLAFARELEIPFFLVFDADGNTTREDHRIKHERDNRALMSLLPIHSNPFPTANIFGNDHAIWTTNLGDAVKADFGAEYSRLTNSARNRYSNEGGLEKHEMFIADWMSDAAGEGLTSNTLSRLCASILNFAQGI